MWFVYVLTLLFLLIKIFMSGWCYNMNSKSLVVTVYRLMRIQEYKNTRIQSGLLLLQDQCAIYQSSHYKIEAESHSFCVSIRQLLQNTLVIFAISWWQCTHLLQPTVGVGFALGELGNMTDWAILVCVCVWGGGGYFLACLC